MCHHHLSRFCCGESSNVNPITVCMRTGQLDIFFATHPHPMGVPGCYQQQYREDNLGSPPAPSISSVGPPPLIQSLIVCGRAGWVFCLISIICVCPGVFFATPPHPMGVPGFYQQQYRDVQSASLPGRSSSANPDGPAADFFHLQTKKSYVFCKPSPSYGCARVRHHKGAPFPYC